MPSRLIRATAALHLALDAVGVKAGDEVLVPTMTFTATAEVVHYLGARPVLVDCQADTLNIDPEAMEKAIGPKTKAVMPVDFAGQPCDLTNILNIAREPQSGGDRGRRTCVAGATPGKNGRHAQRYYLLFVLRNQDNNHR